MKYNKKSGSDDAEQAMFANYMHLRMKRSILPAFLILFLLPALQLLQSCANIIPPGGGPKDSLPPVMVLANPKDSTLHFKGNRITIQFDEYVTIDNPQENLIVSPYPKNQPQVDGKLRTITVKLKDSLEANTTYAINFGHSIKDVNEGNIARQLTYVFSTGDYIDSNYLEGSVQLAENGKLDSTLIVVLHRNLNDSAIYKLRPRYYAKLDGKGHFRFNNLPAAQFSIYAMPNDYNKRYDDSTRLFAFSDSTISVGTHTTPVQLYAFQEYKEQPKRPNQSTSTGSNNNNKKKEKEEDKRLKITGTSLAGPEQDILNPMYFTFNRPLRTFDTTRFILTDTNYKPLPIQPAFSWADTTATRIRIKYPWQADKQLRLIIDTLAAIDSNDVHLYRRDTLHFNTRKESAYGSVKLHFAGIDFAKHVMLQILQNDKIVDSVFITQKEWSRKLYQPGDYELRVLYDTNNDSTWTTGHFWMTDKKSQPELVVPAKPAKITVRGNWDNEWDVSPGNPFETGEDANKPGGGRTPGARPGGGVPPVRRQ